MERMKKKKTFNDLCCVKRQILSSLVILVTAAKSTAGGKKKKPFVRGRHSEVRVGVLSSAQYVFSLQSPIGAARTSLEGRDIIV